MRVLELAGSLIARMGIYDAQAWGQLSWLAGVHERCNGPDMKPIRVEARDLIAGAEWLIKNIFWE